MARYSICILVAGIFLVFGLACATDYLFLASKSIEEEDFESAVQFLEKGSSEGDERCDYYLATLILSGQLSDERDPATAVVSLRNAANAGIPQAQSDLGQLYELGEGVERDSTEAAEWYREAAAGGEPINWVGHGTGPKNLSNQKIKDAGYVFLDPRHERDGEALL